MMEVEKITVKVELGARAVHAVAVLSEQEARTKEGAAGRCSPVPGAPDGAPGHSRRVDTGRRWSRPGWPPGRQRAILRPEHFCFEHEVAYTRQQNDRGSWYSHQVVGGGWCKEGR